jgi:hypothetical protein
LQFGVSPSLPDEPEEPDGLVELVGSAPVVCVSSPVAVDDVPVVVVVVVGAVGASVVPSIVAAASLAKVVAVPDVPEVVPALSSLKDGRQAETVTRMAKAHSWAKG